MKDVFLNNINNKIAKLREKNNIIVIDIETGYSNFSVE